jgi:hypothetical protein
MPAVEKTAVQPAEALVVTMSMAADAAAASDWKRSFASTTTEPPCTVMAASVAEG